MWRSVSRGLDGWGLALVDEIVPTLVDEIVPKYVARFFLWLLALETAEDLS